MLFKTHLFFLASLIGITTKTSGGCRICIEQSNLFLPVLFFFMSLTMMALLFLILSLGYNVALVYFPSLQTEMTFLSGGINTNIIWTEKIGTSGKFEGSFYSLNSIRWWYAENLHGMESWN